MERYNHIELSMDDWSYFLKNSKQAICKLLNHLKIKPTAKRKIDGRRNQSNFYTFEVLPKGYRERLAADPDFIAWANGEDREEVTPLVEFPTCEESLAKIAALFEKFMTFGHYPDPEKK